MPLNEMKVDHLICWIGVGVDLRAGCSDLLGNRMLKASIMQSSVSSVSSVSGRKSAFET